MSGPKVSVYTLTAEQRAILAAERQRRMLERQKRNELIAQISKLKDKCAATGQEASKYEVIAVEQKNQMNSDTLQASIDRLQDNVVALTQELDKAKSFESNIDIEKTLSSVKSRYEIIELHLFDLQEQAKQASDIMQNELKSQIADLFDCPSQEVAAPSQNNQVWESCLAALNPIFEYEHISQSIKQKASSLKKRVLESPELASSVYEIEVQPLLKRFNRFKDEWDKNGFEYESLLSRYQVLLSERNAVDIKMFSFSEKGIAELKKAVAVEEEIAQKKEEQEYISSALNDVMAEMGYPVWGSREVTKRNGAHFRNSLFHYANGAAVNVTYSDNGQISMEIGKVDNQDRLPSAEESHELETQMASFCDDFKEIEERLLKKGVCIKNRVVLSPPSAEYAQIINANDFNIDYEQNIVDSAKAKRNSNLHSRSLERNND